MKIGIISDTHDQIERTQEAIAIFNTMKVDFVYHAGDWCSPFTVSLFKELKCPVKSVLGNNDADIFKIMKNKPSNVEFFDRFHVHKIKDKKIVITHGDPEEIVTALIKSGLYHIIIRGHNHIAEVRKGKTLMINPGNLLGPVEGHDKWTKPSIAVHNLETSETDIIEL